MVLLKSHLDEIILLQKIRCSTAQIPCWPSGRLCNRSLQTISLSNIFDRKAIELMQRKQQTVAETGEAFWGQSCAIWISLGQQALQRTLGVQVAMLVTCSLPCTFGQGLVCTPFAWSQCVESGSNGSERCGSDKCSTSNITKRPNTIILEILMLQRYIC